MVINTDFMESSKYSKVDTTKKHKTPRIENNPNNDVFKESLMFISDGVGEVQELNKGEGRAF